MEYECKKPGEGLHPTLRKVIREKHGLEGVKPEPKATVTIKHVSSTVYCVIVEGPAMLNHMGKTTEIASGEEATVQLVTRIESVRLASVRDND